ncbi:MAG: DUF971 domain-containing protein [Planctomycetota bacterium]
MNEAQGGVEPPESEPTGISRGDGGEIQIQWDDGSETIWTPRQLRDACPCATCREKRRAEDSQATVKGDQAATESKPKSPFGKLPVLSAAEARPLVISGMQPVGRYAYQIGFSDGHRSGLFPLSLLHRGPVQR